MNADFELLEDGQVTPSGKGGPRPNSGRPKGFSPKQNENATADTPGITQATKRAIELSDAKLAKAQADARNAELKFKRDSGEYLSRTAYREASAEAMASCASHIRQLPDILERKFNLAPELVLKIEEEINAALDTLADELEMFVSEDKEGE